MDDTDDNTNHEKLKEGITKDHNHPRTKEKTLLIFNSYHNKKKSKALNSL